MRLLITSFVILFGLMSPSYSEELKDVGVVCKKNNVDKPMFSGIWFKGNEETEWYISDSTDKDKDGDTIEIKYSESFSKQWSYITFDESIGLFFHREKLNIDGTKEWIIDRGWKKSINRFTLKMEEEFKNSKMSYDCEVYSPKGKFLSEIKKREKLVRKYFSKRKI